ncbi:DUF29 family protein [Microcoleus asticus]|uniref:Uncharacterized protein n=1 Tax=Microcoleus asticus IPMA8 TaxID=2563858 RepID=A0ABX2D878_9CYAN|nr:DUF29 family protein [Microcoleus asticus]NQE38671.1 hypothetical protein [Microcoleus asticus IPMA8]
MTTKLEVDRQKLYDTDYLRSIETTVEKLRFRDYSNIGWENQIAKIEDILTFCRRFGPDEMIQG